MALVAAKSSQINPSTPTALLQAALVDFEKILTDEQKRRYHASSTKPEASDVIFLVAEIDATNQDRNRRGFARRLCTFLDATQQFSTIVDTFVNSNPSISALVWGGVRTAMLAASNISSYFDKVSSLVMAIGKYSPTYQQFGRLYPGCTSLQDALCGYYVIVVRLCAKTVEVTNRLAITQLVTSIFQPFEADFSAFVDDLQKASAFIQLQITYASSQVALEAAQLSKWGSEENKAHRRISAKFRTGITKEQKDAQDWRIRKGLREIAKLRADVRDNLTTIRYVKIWNSILRHRSPLTAKWFQQENAFQLWRNGTQSSILWFSGKMGVGKTVLISSIVEHLTVSRSSADIVSYHFCLPERPESLKARNIVGSLVRQALDIYIESVDADKLRVMQKATLEADADDLIDVVSSRLVADKIYIFIIDGIDECEGAEIDIMFQALSTLIDRQPKNLKIVCSSRPELYMKAKTILNIEHRIVVSKDKNSEDIDIYSEAVVLDSDQAGRLKLTNLTLSLEISEVLRSGSDGMFLWIKLFINELCAQKTDGDIREMLRDPPRGIPKLFARLRDRIRSHPAHTDVLRILQFCGVAQRPMSEDEYCELLSLSVGQRYLDQDNIIHNLTQLIEASYGLLYLDEEDATLHYVHHDIRNLVFGHDASESVASTVDLELGFLCLTYLDLDNFKTQLTKTRPPQTSQTLSPVNLANASLLHSKSQSVKLIQKLFSSRQQFKGLQGFDLEKKVIDVLGTSKASELKQQLHYPFLEYAKVYWLDHLNSITFDTERGIWRIFHQCVEGENKLTVRPWLQSPTPDSQDPSFEQLVLWSIKHYKVAMILHSLMFEPEGLTGTIEIAIIEFAAKQNLSSIFFELSKSAKLPKWLLDNTVAVAAEASNPEFIKHLIAAGASIDGHRWDSKASVNMAGKVETDMVNRLVIGATYVNPTRFGGSSPLHLAAEKGNLEVVDMLLIAGANLNISTGQERTPLHLAAAADQPEAADRLINAGADLDARDRYGLTPLHFAASKGATEVATRLYLAGADVDALDKYRASPLHVAAQTGAVGVVTRLLFAGAAVDALDNDGKTPLHYALKHEAEPVRITGECTATDQHTTVNRSQIITELLQAGADIHVACHDTSYLDVLFGYHKYRPNRHGIAPQFQ